MKKNFLFPAVAVVARGVAGVTYTRSNDATDPGSAAPMPVELATTTLEGSRSLYQRQLLPQQTSGYAPEHS